MGAEEGQYNSFSNLPFFRIADFACTSLSMTIAAEILQHFWPRTEYLNSSFNRGLGYTGLQAFIQGVMERKQAVWELKQLYLPGCGLGGTSECMLHLTSSVINAD